MKLLLDTHVFLWAASQPALLPPSIREALVSDENRLLVSAASIWEITVKVAAGREIQWVDRTPPEVLDSFIDRLGATRLDITSTHAAGIWRFRDWANKDPFDRMLATQALAESAMLITADEQLRGYPGLPTLWRA
ncbi:MAG: type II toxin-antitoxin system VapC family toxin [Bryobacteraceae bacterium]|nr:type II toxin-antitoxin system VapC family toxin [Bryobacteraceae bacterium]